MSETNPASWRRIKELVDAALALPASQRVPFLDRMCAGDEALRREVESLIASCEQAQSFMETPAVQAAEKSLVGDQKQLSVGQHIGHYEIVALLGQGGMGEVYLAKDNKLGRKVAIKLLPHFSATDPGRLRRFQQEARTASALNHPNICVIHELGETDDGRPFMSMEYIEGVTLREKIHGERTDQKKLLRYLQHVAEGLAKAHAAGIVHRDLKPDNIMITRDGHAKILDFGLAKLTERTKGAGLNAKEMSAMPTAMMTQSLPGTGLGTIGYMSPEQAQGKVSEIDYRSDIFSFGCVLFETATRRRPFEGKDLLDSLHNIVHAPTPHIKDFNADAPDELQKIVRRCLAKDPDERYQSIKDVAIELKELRRELESAVTDSTMPPSAVSETAKRLAVEATHVQPLGATSGIPPASNSTRASSAEYLIYEIKTHRRGIALGLVAIILLSGASLVYYSYSSRNGGRAAIDSIAVLPLANTNAEPDTEYLSDGITESIINKLSQLPKLRVMARSTVFTYKGKEVDARNVGRDLGVRAVLTGRLVRRDNRLIVGLELVNVTDGTQLWGQRYDWKESEMLAMQLDIAQEVSNHLQLRLSGEEKQQLARDYTRNVEAYQLYLKGRYFWSKFDPESLKKSIEYYNQALDEDPNYALAYAGIADAYSVLANGYLRPRDNYPKSAAAVNKALELDPGLYEAQLTLAFVKFFYEWDWPAVERQVRRLQERNPNDPNVHTLNSYYLAIMGRRDEALAESKRAVDLDPLATHLTVDLAVIYSIRGQYDEAINLLRKSLQTDPKSMYVLLYLGWAYDLNGNYQEAIANYNEVIGLIGRDPHTLAYLARAYAMLGNRGEAQRLLRELIEQSNQTYVFPTCMVYIYLGLGEKDQAFKWLERAYEEKDTNLIAPGIRFDPMLEPLRSDPRYAGLLRRMNLPP